MGVFEDSVATFLGPVKAYLDDDSISEILINGYSEIFVERSGLLEKVSAQFKDEQALQAAVRNIAQFVGRQIDDENPTLDARLPDGSRVAAIIPPCSRKGIALSIRKFQKGMPTFIDWINRCSITKDAARFLDVCVFLGKNVLVSGGTGSGKTTFLNILGSRVPGHQRLIVIEDASELKIHTDHVVNFETKAPNSEGKGLVTMRDLVRASLRLRPDRMIIGEVRGMEAMDLVNALNTGHSGSMGTIHANSPYDALVRLETLAMMSDSQVPVSSIRRQIASAIHLVVHLKRMLDGSRKVVFISEVEPDVDDRGRYVLHSLFQYIQRGRTPEGKAVGELISTGYIPSFMSDIEMNQIPFKRNQFQPPEWYLEFVKNNKTAA